MNDLHNALHSGIPEVVLGAVHDSEQQTTLRFTPDVRCRNRAGLSRGVPPGEVLLGSGTPGFAERIT